MRLMNKSIDCFIFLEFFFKLMSNLIKRKSTGKGVLRDHFKHKIKHRKKTKGG